MRIIGTLMVRDEVDIVAAMVEHHLAQGIDKLVVTDNNSLDGTTEVLEAYAETGLIELFHDLEHRKQQRDVVTRMARRARTEHRADWVLNLDADEFLIPVDKRLTVRQALAGTPLHLNAFTVPVFNLIGPAGWSGSGIQRLVWRDLRTDAALRDIGIHAQPTPNAIHRGESDIVIQQGNHVTSMPSNGQPPPEFAMEVLHLPWRSWTQFERKVVNAGRGYEASPDLKPSPNHHGMADYRRFKEGTLEQSYIARSPLPDDIRLGEASGWYVRDPWLYSHMEQLQKDALRPELLRAVLDTEHLSDPPADLGDTPLRRHLERERRARIVDTDSASA
ncbi:glycosyltransferase family 2 protein [Nocardioides sp. InS609-2]|uniref:glycosyltransferase family 2 protein n=1 Tax=Nocardioides sp. InS609-2 TaxID=2760705 RepID=UPI0020BD685F|nr:glycosyltransferase family 2 protein [Nocardioides sp. InS609-2]